MNDKLSVYVFGAGSMAMNVMPAIDRNHVTIKGVIDEENKYGIDSFLGSPVVSMRDIETGSYDRILILCGGSPEVMRRLCSTHGIAADTMVSLDFGALLPRSPKRAKEQCGSLIRAYLADHGLNERCVNVDVLLASPWLSQFCASEQNGVCIDDYPYVPRQRESFSRSKIYLITYDSPLLFSL